MGNQEIGKIFEKILEFKLLPHEKEMLNNEDNDHGSRELLKKRKNQEEHNDLI